MIGIVLLIASANVANLLLVRGEGRAASSTCARRSARARGASRASLLAESALARVARRRWPGSRSRTARCRRCSRSRRRDCRASTRSRSTRGRSAFALLVTLAAAALFSIAPMLRAARAATIDARCAARAARAPGARSIARRTRSSSAQVALALVLLVSSGLMIRTFEALRAVEPGFAAPAVAADVPASRAAAARARRPSASGGMQNDIVDALEAIPGVESAGFANALPMEQVVDELGRHRGRRARQHARLDERCASSNTSRPGYLAHDGHALVAGRDLDVDRRRRGCGPWRSSPRPSRASSGRRRRPRSASAFGAEARRGPWREVIGVVADVRDERPRRSAAGDRLLADVDGATSTASSRSTSHRAVTFAVRSPLAGIAGARRGRSSRPSGP